MCDNGSFGAERELKNLPLYFSSASSTITPYCSYLDFHCYSQMLKYWDLYGLLFSHTPCLDLLVFWKYLDFQNVRMWRHRFIPYEYRAIGKHEQRAKALVRITGIFKEGQIKLSCFISYYFHYLFAIVCAIVLVGSCIFYTFCKITTSKMWHSTFFFFKS